MGASPDLHPVPDPAHTVLELSTDTRHDQDADAQARFTAPGWRSGHDRTQTKDAACLLPRGDRALVFRAQIHRPVDQDGI